MRVLGIVALCVAVGGCASIARGTSENLNVISNPPGAVATIADTSNDTLMTCVTPCVVSVKRNADISVSAKKEGYQTEGTRLKIESSGTGAVAVAGNVLLGGVVGLGVDMYNGAGFDHKPNPVELTLEPLPTAPPPSPRSRKTKRPIAGAGT
jgi:hypothetical protein